MKTGRDAMTTGLVVELLALLLTDADDAMLTLGALALLLLLLLTPK